jgi:hypothetical protein
MIQEYNFLYFIIYETRQKGCLFSKTKDDDKFFGNLNILIIIFVNTNDLRKKHPDFKLSYIDQEKAAFT